MQALRFGFCVIFSWLVLTIKDQAGEHRAEPGSALANPWLDEDATTGDR
jgi:hypothetical protein